MNDLMQIVTSGGGAAGVIAAFVAYLRTRKGRNLLKRVFGIEPAAQELRDGLDNLSSVVETQGSTIDWLTAQLELYRTELTEARERLKEMDEIHRENTKLRARVAELEEQVGKLETELARRKKYTPKNKQVEE